VVQLRKYTSSITPNLSDNANITITLDRLDDSGSLLIWVGRCRLTVSQLMLKASGTKRLKLQTEKLLTTFAFNFNLRHYIWGMMPGSVTLNGTAPGFCGVTVGRYRFKPEAYTRLLFGLR